MASVTALNDAQIEQLADGLKAEGPLVVTIDDLGTFRVQGSAIPDNSGGAQSIVVVGLSRTDVVVTIGQMLTTIALLTLGGLILLAAATAWTIRAGPRAAARGGRHRRTGRHPAPRPGRGLDR